MSRYGPNDADPNARQYHLKFDATRASGVDDYLEYRRIVGEDDGGTLFTPDQYDEYKKKVVPMRMKNRLFTSWSSPTGMDCKQVGPETLCFCQHRYKQHQTDFETIPSERPIKLKCRAPGCKCASYHYAPLNGSQPIRCTCKHTTEEHSEKAPFLCAKRNCLKCQGFHSSFTCGCGSPCYQHKMIVETAEERELRGHPVGQATPYAAMGGLTGFSSLADGYMRLDPSGRGAPSEAMLNREITNLDNPFLRANVRAIKAHERSKQGAIQGPNDAIFDDIEERVSATKKPGESDMDFFERRYQQRQKLEKEAKRKQIAQENALRTGYRQAIPDKPKQGRPVYKK